MTEHPTSTTSAVPGVPRTDASSEKRTSPRPSPVRRKPAGRASRFVAAGGAVGLSLALCGGMAAAAQHDANPLATEQVQQVRRVVVVPQTPIAPTQIVVVLPGSGAVTTPAQAVSAAANVSAAVRQPIVVPEQAKPTASLAVQTSPAPITESSGS